MNGYDFSELLRIHMNYVAGWIGSNSSESIELNKAIETMDTKTCRAFLEYKNAYYGTNVLKAGFGYNVSYR